MCIVSEKLKLCTCQPQQADSLEHYWVLKTQKTETIMVGEIAMPEIIPPSHEMYNINQLTKMLNAGNCLDVEIEPKDGNILLLYFTCKSQAQSSGNGNYLTYAFTYNKGMWVQSFYDPFASWQDIVKGEIKNALSKNSQPTLSM